ncbi:MAG: NAD(P)H-dependent oxidoreductase [Microcystaceae cyanobacterium]
MQILTPTELLESLQWRYATKKFDPTKIIAPETWSALEDALVLTPSSYGLQPWKFWVITNTELREQLKPFSWGQSQVTDASHYVVFSIKKNLAVEDVDRFVARTAELRGSTIEAIAAYRGMMVSDIINGPRSLTVNEWATRQVYIALGNFMTSAALLGVDACPMEGIDPAKYDKLLGIAEKGYATVVACAAGYRANDDHHAVAAKVRFAKNEVIEVLS